MKALVAAPVPMQGYSHHVLNTIFSGLAQNSPHFHFAQVFVFFFSPSVSNLMSSVKYKPPELLVSEKRLMPSLQNEQFDALVKLVVLMIFQPLFSALALLLLLLCFMPTKKKKRIDPPSLRFDYSNTRKCFSSGLDEILPGRSSASAAPAAGAVWAIFSNLF